MSNSSYYTFGKKYPIDAAHAPNDGQNSSDNNNDDQESNGVQNNNGV